MIVPPIATDEIARDRSCTRARPKAIRTAALPSTAPLQTCVALGNSQHAWMKALQLQLRGQTELEYSRVPTRIAAIVVRLNKRLDAKSDSNTLDMQARFHGGFAAFQHSTEFSAGLCI